MHSMANTNHVHFANVLRTLSFSFSEEEKQESHLIFLPRDGTRLSRSLSRSVQLAYRMEQTASGVFGEIIIARIYESAFSAPSLPRMQSSISSTSTQKIQSHLHDESDEFHARSREKVTLDQHFGRCLTPSFSTADSLSPRTFSTSNFYFEPRQLRRDPDTQRGRAGRKNYESRERSFFARGERIYADVRQ